MIRRTITATRGRGTRAFVAERKDRARRPPIRVRHNHCRPPRRAVPRHVLRNPTVRRHRLRRARTPPLRPRRGRTRQSGHRPRPPRRHAIQRGPRRLGPRRRPRLRQLHAIRLRRRPRRLGLRRRPSPPRPRAILPDLRRPHRLGPRHRPRPRPAPAHDPAPPAAAPERPTAPPETSPAAPVAPPRPPTVPSSSAGVSASAESAPTVPAGAASAPSARTPTGTTPVIRAEETTGNERAVPKDPPPRSGKPRVRKVRRIVRHIEPWSALKLSVLFYTALFLIVCVAFGVLWGAARATGAVDNVESFVTSVGGFGNCEPIDGSARTDHHDHSAGLGLHRAGGPAGSSRVADHRRPILVRQELRPRATPATAAPVSASRGPSSSRTSASSWPSSLPGWCSCWPARLPTWCWCSSSTR